MKKTILIVSVFLALAAAGCRQQEQKQQVVYTPAVQPALVDIDQYQQAARNNPKSAQAWTKLGDVLMDAQRYSEAIEAYEKSLALNPKNVNVLVDQGTCYRGVGKYDIAVKQYRKALLIDPDFPNAHRNLGVVLSMDLHKTDEGIKEFKRYLELVPSGPEADQIKQAMRGLSGQQ